MNKDTAKDYLPLVQALSEGKVIQYKYQKSDNSYAWMDLESAVDFCMPAEFYRIKPEPREVWVNEYPIHRYTVMYGTKEEAEVSLSPGGKTTRYREVIE